MNAANEGRKKNFLSIRPSIPKGFELTIPGSDCFLHLARFRKRNTLVAFALRAGLLKLEIHLMFMHLAQYFWKRGILLLFLHLTRCF